MRNVRAEWTGGPKETNGGYGIYPVLCTDVLIEGCKVAGASDAGIYVGQSTNIVVRRNTVEKNVAGIEIENSNKADVYENVATDNSGGILVFTMPDLPTKDGLACRVFNNKVLANNHENFAPKGNIVASVPPGTGIMIMANDQVEVFDNTIEKNQTTGLSIVSYLLTERPLKDEKYDPYCEAIHVHDNRFAGNGTQPAGRIGEMLSKAMGSPLPDILYDGIVDPKKQVDGKLPDALAVRIHNNGDAGFVNFDAPALTAAAAGSGTGKAPNIVRDLKEYAGTLPSPARQSRSRDCSDQFRLRRGRPVQTDGVVRLGRRSLAGRDFGVQDACRSRGDDRTTSPGDRHSPLRKTLAIQAFRGRAQGATTSGRRHSLRPQLGPVQRLRRQISVRQAASRRRMPPISDDGVFAFPGRYGDRQDLCVPARCPRPHSKADG